MRTAGVCLFVLFAFALPARTDEKTVHGKLGTVASDTMGDLLKRWTEGFFGYHPGVKVEVKERTGKRAAHWALTTPGIAFVPDTAPIAERERKEIEKKAGRPVVEIPAARDTVVVWVSERNPIGTITRDQIAAVYSGKARTWGDLGLTGDWKEKAIRAYGRDTSSGTRRFFRTEVLAGREFGEKVIALRDTSAILRALAADPAGIGYGSGTRSKDGVRAVPLAKRPLYLAVLRKPGEQLPPACREFLRFVLSPAGQVLVDLEGFASLDGESLKKSRKAAGLTR